MDSAASQQAVDPQRYFESVETDSDVPEHEPVCLYLETTNRCNLLCTTCPRTYEELEPPADMSWELFTSIVDQIKDLNRAVLHGVGEPMLVKNLPRMVRYLKDRGTYVLFNTNGTVLNERNGRALIAAGLDELRVSFDAANAETYRADPRQELFQPHPEERARRSANCRSARAMSSRAFRRGSRACARPSRSCRISCGSRPRPASRKCICSGSCSSRTTPSAWRGRTRRFTSGFPAKRPPISTAPPSWPNRSALRFRASGGASEPGMSLEDGKTDGSPWSLCRRPWTVMYFTANGRALPCCIAPFSQRGYENYTLGDATQQTLREIWTGPAYRDFRKALKSNKPPDACASCGLRWSLQSTTRLRAAHARDVAGRTQVAVVIPTFNEAESIAAGRRRTAARVVDRVIVVDGGSTDGTQERAREAGAEVIGVGRGYGLACLTGAQAAEDDDIIVFMDGDGADDPAAIAALVEPIRAGKYDFVIASRARGEREPGSMAVASASRRPRRRLAHRTPLRRALHRHVRLSRHPPRHVAQARHARDDLRLESGNADAGRARRFARAGNAGRLSPASRRRVQGRRLAARLDQGRAARS